MLRLSSLISSNWTCLSTRKESASERAAVNAVNRRESIVLMRRLSFFNSSSSLSLSSLDFRRQVVQIDRRRLNKSDSLVFSFRSSSRRRCIFVCAISTCCLRVWLSVSSSFNVDCFSNKDCSAVLRRLRIESAFVAFSLNWANSSSNESQRCLSEEHSASRDLRRTRFG